MAFRSQPVNYPYILYPLLLVPVFRLNHLLGGDIYRYVQVFNTILVTSSVIPAWLFALDFSKNKRKAFYTALLVSIIPDMIMGGYEMTESLLWPVALWLLYFSYRWFTQEKLTDGLLTALLTALMFFAKPGAVAFGSVLIIARLIISFRNGRRNLGGAILSVLLLLALIGAIYALYIFGFKQETTLLGLYDKQTSEWKSKDILVAIEATFLMTFLFIFSCGGIFAIFPIVFLKKYETESRNYILASLFGMLAVIIGTAVFVVPYKWDSSLGKLPLHMRYCSMFIPAFFVFTFSLDLPARKMKDTKAIEIALIFFTALCFFPGARSGFVRGQTGTIDSIVLSAFHTTNRLNGTATGWIATMIIVCLSVYLIFTIKNGWEKSVQTNAVIIFMGFMLFNTICVHINAAVPIDPTISKDANEVRKLTEGHDCLGVTQRYYDDIYSFWLDCRLNEPMQQVTIDQMFVKMEESNGIYSPFIPIEQAPNVNNHLTTDTDTFVLGKTIAELLEVSDTVQATPTANGHFTVVKTTPGTRWVDSMLYGMDDNTLYNGKTAYLHIFREDRTPGELMNLTISASGDSNIQINGQSFPLTPERSAFVFNMQYSPDVTITAENGDVQIYSYSIEYPNDN